MEQAKAITERFSGYFERYHKQTPKTTTDDQERKVMMMKFETENKGVTPIDVATAVNSYIKEQACRKARALLDSYRQSADLNAVERAQRAQQAITKAAQESR